MSRQRLNSDYRKDQTISRVRTKESTRRLPSRTALLRGSASPARARVFRGIVCNRVCVCMCLRTSARPCALVPLCPSACEHPRILVPTCMTTCMAACVAACVAAVGCGSVRYKLLPAPAHCSPPIFTMPVERGRSHLRDVKWPVVSPPLPQQGIGKNMLLHCFEMTTTAHCSVPRPKRPSDKAGPSD